MNFDLVQFVQQYWVHLVVIAIISFFIYRIQTRDYYHGIEYFQSEQLGMHNPFTPPVVINVRDFEFSPNYIIITPNTEVRWTNIDSGDTSTRANRVHSIVETQHGIFHSPDLQMNDSFRYKFTLPGTYHYHSRQYPTARGTIIVKMEGQ